MPLWVSPLTLADIAAFSQPTAPGNIGVTFTAIGDDWLEGSVPLDERTRTPEGTLDPGAIAILAETLASVGATMCVDLTRQACLGQVLHLQHARLAERGPVRGRARALWIQPRSQLWEIDVSDGVGARICIAQLTLAVVDRPAEVGGAPAGAAAR
jgi:1,4-dihydroxy-2-naphthoyl-CoA hydrolase